jgi:signal transduction histidine kinase
MGALAAGIAHEIKNPLNFVINFAELSSERIAELRSALDLLDGKADPAVLANIKELAGDVQESVTKIREHGARADRIVASMLAHSRGQRGDRRPTDLNSLVREYVSLAFHGVRARDSAFHVTLKADYDPAVGEPSVAPNDLSRVILNVASNAFYALSAKAREDPNFAPELSVVTRGFDDRVEVRIRDNGPGMDRQQQSKIFEPFFTTKTHGTGLGMAISKRIVDAHGGYLSVGPHTAPGRGAEIVIVIPKEQA